MWTRQKTNLVCVHTRRSERRDGGAWYRQMQREKFLFLIRWCALATDGASRLPKRRTWTNDSFAVSIQQRLSSLSVHKPIYGVKVSWRRAATGRIFIGLQSDAKSELAWTNSLWGLSMRPTTSNTVPIGFDFAAFWDLVLWLGQLYKFLLDSVQTWLSYRFLA